MMGMTLGTVMSGKQASMVAVTALLVTAMMSVSVARAIEDQAATIDPEDIPSVHNTFYTAPEGTVSWDVLGTLDIEIEVIAPLQSQMNKSFTDEVKALDDETVQIMGFLYPLEGGLTHERFLLTAWPPSCPFCLPAGPTLMVEVMAAEPVEFGEGAIMMAGRFDLLDNDPSGLYYRLQDATLVERFDDIRWTGQGLNTQTLPR